MDTEEVLKRKKLKPTQSLVLGIILVVLLGAIILRLPISNNKPITFIDSFFYFNIFCLCYRSYYSCNS